MSVQVDKYFIYRGARFSVQRARRAGGVEVIIKQPCSERPELHSDERLRHEYEILRSLSIRGVSRPLDFTTIDGKPALVLEDAGQRSLAQVQNRHPLPIERFFALAIRMAEIVGALHAHSTLHRDICSDNFVLGDSPTDITLVDFESATQVPAFAEILGVPGALEGSLAYMPPEQTGRMRRLVDRRTDLYALGATFYEMLTGQPPFVYSDPLELVHAHAARAPYPPAVLDSAVPAVVSDIVMKLLAKMPEWRYQTAEALLADLREAQGQWQGRGEIAKFELGRQDLPYGLFREPDRLYGRDKERDAVAQAIERVSAGATEVVLIAGPAGIGKSALVSEIQEGAGAKCRWLRCKGELLRGNLPYAPLIEAFRGLLQELLSEPEPVLAKLRETIGRAVDKTGRVLIEAIPDLQALLGELPPVAEVGAVEAENRFHLVFTAFIRALIASRPPLILFLDDLQWIDVSSLKVIRAVAADPEVRSLLILCAYRSEEVGLDTPLARTLDLIRTGGPHVTSVALPPLDMEALVALLCNALRKDRDKVVPLAEQIRRKTAGNPFFVRQFLGYLYRRCLLVFSAENAEWSWDLAGVESQEVTTNVIDMLLQIIGTLPQEARQALEAAACIGNRFELGLLCRLREEPMDVTAKALWAPVEQGLLVPAAEGPRFHWAQEKPVELGTAVAPTYRFVHDRIQQAAYELLSKEERQRLHLRIGRLLEENVPKEAFESALGPIVDQLNRATELLSEADRIRLADLNERAGRQARAAPAYASALGYFLAGLPLLPEEAWRTELHTLWLALQRGAAECAGLSGEHELSERLVDQGIARTEDLLEKISLYAISVQTHALRGDHLQAIRRGLCGLALLGMELSLEPSADEVRDAKERTRSRLRLHTETQLCEQPPMADPLDRARLQLLTSLSSTWFTAVELFKVVSFRAAELTATHGRSEDSAVAYVYYAIALDMEGEYAEAYKFGRLAVRLAEQQANRTHECRTLLCFGGHVSPWRAPIYEVVPILQRSYCCGLDSGELAFAAYALANLVFVRMFHGAQLDQILMESESALAFYRKVRHPSGIAYIMPFVRAAKCLKGGLRGPAGSQDEELDEARFLDEIADNGLGQAMFYVLQLQVCYLLGKPELAHEYARRSAPWLSYLRTLFFQADAHFYAALTLAALGRGATPAARKELISQMQEHLQKLEIWAKNAPANYQHKHALVCAERARLEGQAADALTLYHRAIEHAGIEEFKQDEALAHELCMRFHLARGENRMAELHLYAAIDGYCAWGALAKVKLLEWEFPSLRVPGGSKRVTSSPAPPVLDYLSLLKATETLTEELSLDRLLEKLIRTCSEAANAERAVLVLEEGGLFCRAAATATGEVTLQKVPFAASNSFPKSIVEHVFHSKELLVIGNAAHEGGFLADAYVSEHGVRSILAVPIVRADSVLGVLYFENNAASDAFTSDRAELFRLLSAQMAIALENSRLFEERKRGEAALRLLSDASAQLTEAFDYEAILTMIGAIVVPSLADFCITDILENGALRPIAWAHVDKAAGTTLEEICSQYALDTDSLLHRQVLQSGKSLLISEVTEDILRSGSRDEVRLRLIQDLHPRSLMIVPLLARSRSIGVVTLATIAPARRFEAADHALAEELFRRIGLALDNARLYRDLQGTMRQLARSEARLEEAQRVAHIGSFEWDIPPNVLVWSDELQRIYGLEPGQFSGTFEAFLSLVHPDEIDSTRKAIFDAYRKLGPFIYDHRIVRADGSTRVLHTRGEVIKDAHGQPIRMIGTCWDVTELTEATQARERSLSLLQATIEATNDGILVVDRNRQVTICNQRFLNMWRIPPEVASSRQDEQMFASITDQLEEPDEFLRKIHELYALSDVESTDLLRFKDGRVFERYSRPQRIGDTVVGRVWSFRDISERERLLNRALFLADATRLLASLDVEQALDSVAHLAIPYLGDGCAIDIFGNGAPRRLIAVSRDQARPISSTLHPTVLGGRSATYQVGSISYLGVPLLMKGKLVGAITLSASPRRRYTPADLDLAEELSRRAALSIDNARLYQRAQEALRARDEFLAIAAHEIRGPVNSIHLSIQTLRMGTLPPDALARLYDTIERQDRRLSQFVNELLDIGRIQTGQLQLEYEDVNLGDVVRDVVTRLGPELGRCGSSLTVTAPGLIMGHWDRFRLDQVVNNLLSNAIKFGLGKPIEIVLSVRDGQATLVVKDHGIGIAPAERERLFKPFERGVSVRHYGGLGLGLHIVKTIVDALGGSVTIDGKPGLGTTFVVTLPQNRAEGESHAHSGS